MGNLKLWIILCTMVLLNFSATAQATSIREAWNEMGPEGQWSEVLSASSKLDNKDKIELYFKQSMVTAMDSYGELNEALGFGAPLGHWVAIPAGLGYLWLTTMAVDISSAFVQVLTPNKRTSIAKNAEQAVQELENYSTIMQDKVGMDIDGYVATKNNLKETQSKLKGLRAEKTNLSAERIQLVKERVQPGPEKNIKLRSRTTLDGLIESLDSRINELEIKRAQFETKSDVLSQKTNYDLEASVKRSETKIEALEIERGQLLEERILAEKIDELDDKIKSLESKTNRLGSEMNKLRMENEEKLAKVTKDDVKESRNQLVRKFRELAKGRPFLYRILRFVRGTGLGIVTIGGISAYSFFVGDMLYFVFDKCDGNIKVCPDMERLREKYQSDVLETVLSNI